MFAQVEQMTSAHMQQGSRERSALMSSESREALEDNFASRSVPPEGLLTPTRLSPSGEDDELNFDIKGVSTRSGTALGVVRLSSVFRGAPGNGFDPLRRPSTWEHPGPSLPQQDLPAAASPQGYGAPSVLEPGPSGHGIQATLVLGEKDKLLSKETGDRIQNEIRARRRKTDAVTHKRRWDEDSQTKVSHDTVRRKRHALQLPAPTGSVRDFGPDVHNKIRRQVLAHGGEDDAATREKLWEGGRTKVSHDTVWKDQGTFRLPGTALVERLRSKTGIVPSHLIKLQSIAREHRCLIGVRPVDRFATDLIEAGYPTKGFHIKGKSANWGPQAGFICVDQRFSKLENKPNLVPKFDLQVQSCIKDGYAKKISLVLLKSRVDKLVTAGLIFLGKRDSHGIPVNLEAKAPSGKVYTFDVLHVYRGGEEAYEIAYQGKAVAVLAPPKDGANPLTADYDLFVIGPRWEDFGVQDKLPLSDVSHNVFKARRRRDYKHLPESLQREYDDPAVYHAREDKDVGNASLRVREMIPLINRGLAGDGEPVVHHNADSASPATDPDANYPLTFVMPQKIGRFDMICIVHDKHELVELIVSATEAGYYVPRNPMWENEVTQVRSKSFGFWRNMEQLNQVAGAAPRNRPTMDA